MYIILSIGYFVVTFFSCSYCSSFGHWELLQSWFLCPFHMSGSFFEHFFTFWHPKCPRLLLFSLCPSFGINHLPKIPGCGGDCFCFLTGGSSSEDKIWAVSSLLLGCVVSRFHQCTELRNICVYTNSCIHSFVFIFVSKFICFKKDEFILIPLIPTQ